MARILVVDDNADIRRCIGFALRGEQHEVLEAADGDRALKMLREEDFDVIICDIFMPDREGLETIQEMRAIKPAAPIIAMSGGGDWNGADVLPMARALGARRCLEKPFSASELM